MNEPMKKYMKVGIVHSMAYPGIASGRDSVEGTLKKIATDDFFDAVEIGHIQDPTIRDRAKKIAEVANMTVSYAAGSKLLPFGLNINSLDEAARQKAIIALKEGIDEAYELGAVDLGFLSGKYSENTKEESFQALVSSTKELCAYAKDRGGLKIVLEVFDYDIDKKSLIGPVELAKRFAEEIAYKYDNFGLMVDLSHLPLLRESSAEAIFPIKEFIVHAHIGNCVVKNPRLPGYGDMHPRFGFPESANDCDQLVDFLRNLFEIGFLSEKRPIVSFEVKPFDDEDPDLVVANAKRTLGLSWAKL